MDHWSFWCYMQTPEQRVTSLWNVEISESKIPYYFPIYDEEETTYNITTVTEAGSGTNKLGTRACSDTDTSAIGSFLASLNCRGSSCYRCYK